MALVKMTEGGQKRRSARLEALRLRVAALKRLDNFKNSADWKDLKSIISNFAEMEKRQEEIGVIDCCQKEGLQPWDIVSGIRAAREKRAAYESIIDLVEKAQDNISTLDNTIKEVENEYREAKEQLA
jgi:hypothetical protein